MAKLIVMNNGFRLWALTKAEDHLLIDAYLLIKRFVPKSDQNFYQFERRYFEHGSALADKDLLMLNGILGRKGYDPLHLREGHSDSYTAMKGRSKAWERSRIREAFEAMNDRDRCSVIASKTDEVNRQADRDPVYDATKAARLTPLEPLGMGKAARTALTEQLIAAVEDGRLAMDHRTATASIPVEKAPPGGGEKNVPSDGPADSRKRRVLIGLPRNVVEPVVEEVPMTAKQRLGTVKLAMLAAVESKVAVLEGELAEVRNARVADGALHAAVTEIERLKQVIDVDRKAHQAELHSLRDALRSFQASIAAVAIAA